MHTWGPTRLFSEQMRAHVKQKTGRSPMWIYVIHVYLYSIYHLYSNSIYCTSYVYALYQRMRKWQILHWSRPDFLVFLLSHCSLDACYCLMPWKCFLLTFYYLFSVSRWYKLHPDTDSGEWQLLFPAYREITLCSCVSCNHWMSCLI